MRRTARRRKKYKKDKLMGFLAFFVLAPIISIFIGFSIVKYIIIPQFNSGETTINTSQQIENTNENTNLNSQESKQSQTNQSKNENQEKTEKTIEITPNFYTIYNIQVGSFTDENNAQLLINDMKEKGFGGYILNKDNFKVFAGSFYNREEADEYLTGIKEVYKEAFINSLHIESKKVNYDEKDAQNIQILLELLDKMDNTFSEESSLWGGALNNDDLSMVKEMMINNTKEIEDKVNSVRNKISSDEVTKLISHLDKIISSRKSIISTIESGNYDEISLYSKFYSILHDYIKNVYTI